MKTITTSNQSVTFNALAKTTTHRLNEINKLVKYQLGFVCGTYKAAYDISPGSVKHDEKELNDTIKKIITTNVSNHKNKKFADRYFGNMFSELEAYKKAAADEHDYANFSSQVFGDSSKLVFGFSEGYIQAIKSLCADYSIPFTEPHSEINCILKNWKFFFLPPDDKIEFRVDGTFFWGPKAVIEEEINQEIYAKLKKCPSNSFHNIIDIANLSEFLN